MRWDFEISIISSGQVYLPLGFIVFVDKRRLPSGTSMTTRGVHIDE